MIGQIGILRIDCSIEPTINRLLQKSKTIRFHVTQAESLNTALQKLQETSFEAILLKLDPPDTKGLKNFQLLQRKYPEIPILILSDEWDEKVALKAIDHGAQNFLVLSGIKASTFIRQIILAIHRHKYRLILYAQQSLTNFALDRLVCGVILIGPGGRVLSMNQCAKEIIAARDGLLLESGHIHCSMEEHEHALQHLISAILGSGALTTSHHGGQLTVCRKSKASLNLLITPLNLYSHVRFGSKTGVAIFISDTERMMVTIEEMLRNEYRLTRAEARLCCLIVQGMSVSECSQNLTITVNTVRDHLKKIFFKTGTTRQTDLVRLLLTQPPATED